MSNLKGQPAEVRAVIHIKRAATGKTETYELIGHTDPEKLKEIMKNKAREAALQPQSDQEPSK